MIWYKQNTQQLFEALETSEAGLSEPEALKRLSLYGKNQLEIKKDSFWKQLIEPFRSVFVAVLVLAALVSLLSGEQLDAIIIAIIVFINATVYYSQQYATSRVLRSLKRTSFKPVSVIRDGQAQELSALHLVPGDIVLLSEGERIPADARIVHSENIQIDEASLTGESVPVHKFSTVLETTKQLYEQDNMAFQGTYVISGSARAVVVETASRTQFGQVAALVSDDHVKSPVQAKIDQLITMLVKVAGGLAVIVFILSLARGIPSAQALRFVLSLTVSAAPEGLPVALTVIIVLGMRRMAKKQALVRNFKAIEDIGLITTIATDKTGTLTKNHLKVVDSWSLGKQNVMQMIEKTIDPSVAQTDPLDQAIQETSGNSSVVDAVYPFELKLRMSGAYSKKDGLVYIKGSPEHVLSQSQLSNNQHQSAESAMHELTSKGYRVIAFATYKVTGQPPKDLGNIRKKDIQFVGYVAFADELRAEAKEAIRAAHQAGISVRLITGDHYETAYNIGKQIGLASSTNQVIQGTELPKDTHALAEVIKDKTIFARILPEDKFRILQALKQTEITAMTGDGVNDVPALANAHVGIAMGSGSDIARDAGGIVLLNDNFATIVAAISEGRKIFDNIRRMLLYLLSTSLGEVLTMIGALLLGLPLPVTAIQILWINLVTDTAMVLPLGLEPSEDGHMKRPPRHPKDPLLNKVLYARMVLVASTMALVTLAAVFVLKKQGNDTQYIQTVAFMMLVSAQWMNAFNSRSEYKSSFSRIKNINYGLSFGFTLAVISQMLVMFGPLKPLFDIQTVPIQTLLIATGVSAVAVLAVSEIHKWIIKINKRKVIE